VILFLVWITGNVLNHRWIYIGLFIFIGLIGTSLYRTVKYNIRQINSGPIEVLEIARKFDANHNDTKVTNDILIARKPQIAYYMRMRFHPIPMVNSTDELLEYCLINHINYIFASSVEVNLRPALSPLLDLSHIPRGFSPIVITDAGNAILYKVEPGGVL
jgi:hypothetical protein